MVACRSVVVSDSVYFGAAVGNGHHVVVQVLTLRSRGTAARARQPLTFTLGEKMKWFLCALLFSVGLCQAEQGSWNYLEVYSVGADWEIFQSSVIPLTISSDGFSVKEFEAEYVGKSKYGTYVHSYEVQGTFEKSSNINGQDVVAIFRPLETEALPETCKGKYIRKNNGAGLSEEINFRCDGSSIVIRSFKRFTKRVQ